MKIKKKRYCFLSLMLTMILFSISFNRVEAQIHNNEIMNLRETADWLKITPEELDKLVEEQIIPGKRLGKNLRFSRAALLKWLSTPSNEIKNSEPICPNEPLSKLELSLLSARGTSNPTGGFGKNPSVNPIDPVGQKPKQKTAEEVLLRDEGVLLKAKEFGFEIGFFYSHLDQQDSISGLERETFTYNLIARYGLLDNFQIYASLPYLDQSSTVTNMGDKTTNRKTEMGDATIGMRYGLFKERLYLPSIILSLEAQIPTGDGPYAISLGTSLVKSFDPAFLFGHIQYKRTFSKYDPDVTRLTPENTTSISLGYGYAINDSLTLSTMVSGLFSGETNFSENNVNTTLKTRRQFSLQFGLTTLIQKNFYMEFTVAIGLNKSAPDVTFGLNLPFSFGS